MTDRYNYLTVVLAQDTRSDDAEPLVEAIKQMRGVVEVRPNVTAPGDFAAYSRARSELTEKLWAALKSDWPKL